jgi:hypothetical protein
MLKAIKLDAKSIKKAINDVDANILPRPILQELLKFIPTDEELNALKAIPESDYNDLAFAETFMLEISEIEKYGDKLQALYFMECFPEYEYDADSMIASLQGASEDIKNSKKFRDVLQVLFII